MERLSDLTASITQQNRHAGAMQSFWLLAKHGASGGADSMKATADRLRFANPDLHRVLMADIGAGTTTTAGWASELAAFRGLTADWVKSLTAQTLLGALQYFRSPFLTRTIMDTSPGAAAWTAEGAPIPMSRMSLTTKDALGIKKVAALVPLADELLESWGPAQQANLEDLIARAVRYAIDRSLLDPDASVSAARPASLTNGIAPISTSGTNATAALANFENLINPVLADSIDPSRILIAMSPQAALHYAAIHDAGVPAFPLLGATGGSILGIKVAVSKAARSLGSPAAHVIACIDGSRILVADDFEMDVALATATSVSVNDAPVAGAQNHVSLFQTNTQLLRIRMYKNFQRASDSAVSWFYSAY